MKEKDNNHIEELAKRLKNGDRSVMEDLYDNYSSALYGVCLRMFNGNEEQASDILQESFVKIWKYGKSYDPSKGRLYTWMINITRNTAIDHLRKRKKEQKNQELDDSVYRSEDIGSEELNIDVIDLDDNLKSLDNKYNKLIRLSFYKGLTHKQIADSLEMPLGTVKTRIRTGIQKLREVYLEK